MAHPHNSGGVTDLLGPWFTHPGAGGFAVAIALWGLFNELIIIIIFPVSS